MAAVVANGLLSDDTPASACFCTRLRTVLVILFLSDSDSLPITFSLAPFVIPDSRPELPFIGSWFPSHYDREVVHYIFNLL
jgi:hypothetical protein